MGLPADAPERVAAGVAYALNEASEEGHVFLPTAELVKLTAELLKVAPALIGIGLARMWNEAQVKVAPTPGAEAIEPQPTFVAEPRLVAEQGQLYAVHTVDEAQRLLAEENAIYLTPLYFSEVGVARRLQRLLHAGESRLAPFARYRQADWARVLAAAETANGFPLAAQQRQAVQAALTHRGAGSPGGRPTASGVDLDLDGHHVGHDAGLLVADGTRPLIHRGDMATGFELDVITMVLLGGVSIFGGSGSLWGVLLSVPVSYTHLRAHETVLDLVCRLLLEKKKRSILTTQDITQIQLETMSSIDANIGITTKYEQTITTN